MTPDINEHLKVPHSYAGSRLDQIASELFPDFSRSMLQNWIKQGALTVDGRTVKPKTKLSGGESLELKAELEVMDQWEAEDIPLDCVYEDDSLLVLNKPSPMVVHPGAGNWSGTMLNGLLYQYPELAQIPRAGIVHRLDKETTGLMVVAKDPTTQLSLVEQLQDHSVARTYFAVVRGNLKKPGVVDAPIGRHPTQRIKMAVVNSGKPSLTHYRPLRRFPGFTLVELKLETGRTHQIRVHMTHIGFPLVGDPVYGGKPTKNELNKPGVQSIYDFPRQALHAKELGLRHPQTNEACHWRVDLPDDILRLLDDLEGLREEQ